MWRLWCVLLVAGNVMAAEAYKCKGKNGELIFSDQPCAKNAELIELKEPQTFSAPSRPNMPVQEPTGSSATERVSYKELRIDAPKSGEIFDDGSGNVRVSVFTSPQLAPNHVIQLYLNGEPYGSATRQYAWALMDLDRGEYQIRAEIQDEKGRALMAMRSSFVVVKRIAKGAVTAPGLKPKEPPKETYPDRQR